LISTFKHPQGVLQDYVQAHTWFNIAATNPEPRQARDSAIKNRDAAASLMTTAQIEEAQRLTRDAKAGVFSSALTIEAAGRADQGDETASSNAITNEEAKGQRLENRNAPNPQWNRGISAAVSCWGTRVVINYL